VKEVHSLADNGETLSLIGLAEPRIEPEIVFGLAVAPTPAKSRLALLTCLIPVAPVTRVRSGECGLAQRVNFRHR
jgi:hypothetical protein